MVRNRVTVVVANGGMSSFHAIRLIIGILAQIAGYTKVNMIHLLYGNKVGNRYYDRLSGVLSTAIWSI